MSNYFQYSSLRRLRDLSTLFAFVPKRRDQGSIDCANLRNVKIDQGTRRGGGAPTYLVSTSSPLPKLCICI